MAKMSPECVYFKSEKSKSIKNILKKEEEVYPKHSCSHATAYGHFIKKEDLGKQKAQIMLVLLDGPS